MSLELSFFCEDTAIPSFFAKYQGYFWTVGSREYPELISVPENCLSDDAKNYVGRWVVGDCAWLGDEPAGDR
jgi:hypothetical protein